MSSRKRGEAGVVLVETAFVSTLLILFVLAAIALFMTFYQQIEADTSAVVLSHEWALGTDDKVISPQQALQYLQVSNPNLNKTNYTTSQRPGDPPLPVNIPGNVLYGSASQSARTGGTTYILPTQRVVTTNLKQPIQMFSAQISVRSFAIEADFRELCPHFCINSGAGYTASNSVPYFLQGSDTPAFFGSWQYGIECDSIPNNIGTGKTAPEDGTLYDPAMQLPTWDTCPANKTQWREYGTAMHLESKNYNNGINGMVQDHPADSSTFDASRYGVFFEAWCHRRFYARIAEMTMYPYATRQAVTNDLAGFLDSLYGKYTKGRLTPGVYSPGPAYIIYKNGSFDTPNSPTPGWDATGTPNSSSGLSAYQANSNPSVGCSEY